MGSFEEKIVTNQMLKGQEYLKDKIENKKKMLMTKISDQIDGLLGGWRENSVQEAITGYINAERVWAGSQEISEIFDMLAKTKYEKVEAAQKFIRKIRVILSDNHIEVLRKQGIGDNAIVSEFEISKEALKDYRVRKEYNNPTKTAA